MRPARFAALLAVSLVGTSWAVHSATRPRLTPKASFWDADLRRADLSRADGRGALLWGAKLGEARLTGARLMGAKLGGADLRGADLSGVDLRGANLCFADLRGSRLHTANLCGADLRGAQLEGADLGNAAYDGQTRWPVGFRVPRGMVRRGVASPVRAADARSGTVLCRAWKRVAVQDWLGWAWTLQSAADYTLQLSDPLERFRRRVQNGSTVRLDLVARHLPEGAARRMGYSAPGLRQMFRYRVLPPPFPAASRRGHSRDLALAEPWLFSSGPVRSEYAVEDELDQRTYDFAVGRRVQPSQVHAPTDLSLELPAEVPLLTVGGRTAVLHLEPAPSMDQVEARTDLPGPSNPRL